MKEIEVNGKKVRIWARSLDGVSRTWQYGSWAILMIASISSVIECWHLGLGVSYYSLIKESNSYEQYR